ncbi:hypothetical protein EIP86_002428 [Pleurotus ostreatoroseus]|nr:hypothetical protein EIP86_002428 [Pleurotus ostreatoroseus]
MSLSQTHPPEPLWHIEHLSTSIAQDATSPIPKEKGEESLRYKGSLFNHSKNPNVSYTLDHGTESIRYTTTRTIGEGEELCIFYGHKLWFQSAEGEEPEETVDEPDDGWGGLTGLQDEYSRQDIHKEDVWPLLEGDPDDIIPEEQLPFTRIKLIDDEDEDIPEAVRLEKAWVVDIPDPRHTTTMLKWLKTSGLDTPTFSHLKRIRKNGSVSTLLLAPVNAWPKAPTLPDDIALSEPYTVDVPRGAALTQISLKLKSAFWPTIYAPRKKGELEPWSRAKVRWAWEAVQEVVREARKAKNNEGELPIVAYVPVLYDQETKQATQMTQSFMSHDTRRATKHPLRHAALNLVRRIADYRASSSAPTEASPALTPPVNVPTAPAAVEDIKAESDSSKQNGSHYLLTGLTLFISHEPCIMCSMALLHSRVKEIVYLVPMHKTGGCGSVACVPKLDGVNHRFGISRWRPGEGGVDVSELKIDEAVDA